VDPNDPTTATFSCSVTIPRYAEAGAWIVSSVNAVDAVGNSTTVSAFPPLPPWNPVWPTNLTVTDANPDTTPPALGAFGLSPTTVNVTSSSAGVTCTMPLTDSPAGVDAASCIITGPAQGQGTSCVATAPFSGTRQSGTFRCTATIPRYAAAGAWTASVVAARDLAGNNLSAPLTNQVTVTDANPDTQAPTLTGFSFQPASVDPSAAPQPVTCTFPLTDSPAGVSFATCTFTSPVILPQSQSQSQSCVAIAPSSGSRTNGTFSCNVLIPTYSDGGLWTVSTDVIDSVGNSASSTPASTLNVVCAGDPETRVAFRTDKATLYWGAVAGALSYDVYRGDLPGLPANGYGICQGNTSNLFFNASGNPNRGKGYYYLVAYKTSSGEKGLGKTSSGSPRTPKTSCP
jgi:hypothetical protein